MEAKLQIYRKQKQSLKLIINGNYGKIWSALKNA